eukprot:scaffold187464_cov27-Tisochrysis_lutea.AAC.2
MSVKTIRAVSALRGADNISSAQCAKEVHFGWCHVFGVTVHMTEGHEYFRTSSIGFPANLEATSITRALRAVVVLVTRSASRAIPTTLTASGGALGDGSGEVEGNGGSQ